MYCVSCSHAVTGPIVSLIIEHGGDVIKFAGDALLCLFAPSPSAHLEPHECPICSSPTPLTPSSHPHTTCAHLLRDATYRAAYCASLVHARFNNHHPAPDVTLTLHSAISCGLVYGVCVGGHAKRWEFLLKGAPITQLAAAMDVAQHSMIVMTPQVC